LPTRPNSKADTLRVADGAPRNTFESKPLDVNAEREREKLAPNGLAIAPSRVRAASYIT